MSDLSDSVRDFISYLCATAIVVSYEAQTRLLELRGKTCLANERRYILPSNVIDAQIYRGLYQTRNN